MNKVLVGFFLMMGLQSAYSSEFESYQWVADRARYELSEEENAYAEYILKTHDQYDYVFEGDNLYMYKTTHWIVKVNTNDAIEHFNRIYISNRNVIKLVELKARSINKEGKVVNFDRNNLKEVKEEESGGGYQIFAMEGVEQGSEIEYYYTLKKSVSIYDRVFMQFSVPVKESSFALSSPQNLKFDIKSYGGYPSFVENSDKERNRYSIQGKNLPGLREENFATYNANRQRVEFKLAYNTNKSNARLYTWDDAAKAFYRVLSERTKEDDKALDKFAKSLGDKSSDPLDNRIQQLENKIKIMVQVDRDNGPSDVESIVKTKVASREGITKLFSGVYELLGIECQPVITCDRNDSKFDESFDTWSYLDEYLLYFPKTKKFMAPYHFETRYPVVPPALTAHKGLFIEPFAVGNVRSALSSIKEIPALDYSINTDDLAISVEFNDDLTSNQIHLERTFGGVNASFIVPYYGLMKEEQRSKMVEELLKETAPDAVIGKWTAKPEDKNGINNFLMIVDFKSNHFLETAGPRVLFKVGELIGPQSELYREEDRMSPIENDYNRGYERGIEVKIPAGYQVRNADDLNISVIYKDGDKEPYLFVSTYTMNGNVLKITVKEYYKEIYAPIERYEDYRKVINAAADFNKVTLVLEKK